MIFDAPVPFREAVKIAAGKKVMPTSLTSAELSQLNKGILRSSMTSAQTTIEGLLDRYKSGVLGIVKPEQATRVLEDGTTTTVTEGFNPAKLRAFIKGYLERITYQAPAGKEGTIEDLSSDGRINLVVKTNVELAQGAGKFVQGNLDEDVIDLWPAWELVRYEERDQPRDWEQRWRIAAQVASDVDAARVLEEEGRMVALKSSGIWDELGDGAGGYLDTLGNPYPPFAFNSGMWTEDVSRDEAEELGLLDKGEKAEGAEFDFASLFGAAS